MPSSGLGLTARVLIGLAAGLAVGQLFALTPLPGGDVILAVAAPLGQIWVNAIRMTVVPLVVALLFVGVASAVDVAGLGRLGARAAILFLSSVAASSALAVAVAWTALNAAEVDPGLAATVAPGAAVTAPEIPSIGEWLVALVPTNAFGAAAEGALLPLIVFTLAFGAAASRLPVERRQPLLDFFRAVADAMQLLVGWILAAAPLGVFALAIPLAARVGIAGLWSFAYYIALVVLVCCLVISALYPVGVVAGGVPLRQLARSLAPAQGIAAGARSSVAALPVMLREANGPLRLPEAATAFFLPLAVSIFRITAPIVMVVGVIFLARIYGVTLVPAQLVTIAAMSAALSFSVPAIPGGSVLVMVPVLMAVGVPVDGVALLLAIDTVPDMFRTMGNVTSQLTLAAVVAGRASPADAFVARSSSDALSS